MATVTEPSTALPDPGDDMDAEQVRDWITNVINFLEGTNIDEANVDTSGTDGIVGKSVAQTITGLKTLESTSAGGGGVRETIKLGLNPSSGTPANSDGARVTLYMDDAGGTAGDRAYIDVIMEAATAGAVNAYVRVSTDVADTVTAGFAVGKIDTHLDVYAPARTHTAATSTYIAYFRPGGAQTIPAGTTALVATARFDEPNITATGTVTNAATVYVAGAPTEGGTGNYSLWVAAGAAQLDGALVVGGATSLNGNVTVGNATGDALTFHPSAWTLTNAVTITGTWTDLGIVTTVDVNGGTIDGATIGAASAGAGTFTTVTLATLNATASTISSNATTFSFDSAGTIDTSGNNVLALNSGTAHLDITTGLLDVTGPITASGVITTADLDAPAGTISSNATTLSFDAGATIDTSGNNALTLNAGTAALTITAGDATLYDATNNADTSLSIGTSATERLLIQVLNGAANQSAESINIVSQTAAAGAHAGQITIGVDDATILTIDDGGINAILGATTAAAATVTTLTASSTVNISTATNWQLGGVAFTGSMANLNTLRDDSMADALHRHSELSASDGTPNPAVQVDAAGLVGIGGAPAYALDIFTSAGPTLRLSRTPAGTYPGGLALTADGAAGYISSSGAALPLIFRINDVEKARIDAAGNVGIGVVPYGTGTGNSAFYLGGNGVFQATTPVQAGAGLNIAQNAQFDTDNSWEYISTDEATLYRHLGGAHEWHVAASGTAGNDITWTQAMTLTNAGQLLVGTATASANAAGPSLLIAQGANDDAAFLVSSSDVAQPFTASHDATKWLDIRKSEATSGGAQIWGLKDADGAAGYALYLRGFLGEAANTTHTTAGVGVVVIGASVTDAGTGQAAVGADGNLLTVENAGSTKFIVDAEGDLFADGSDVTVYDEYDDVQLVRAFDLASNSDRLIRTQWDEYVRYREDDLVKAGILGAPRSEGGLVCVTQLQRLHNGAIWQLGTRQMQHEERMVHLEAAVAARDIEIAELRQQMALLKEVN